MKLKDWATTAEIVGNFAVVLTVAVLILEVRGNTAAVERQARLERVSRINEPYLANPAIPEIYATIKDVDGQDEPLVAALSERYDLSTANSVRWARHMYDIWAGLEADHRARGASPHLENHITDLLAAADQQLFWEHREGYLGAEFVAYVDGLLQRP